MSTEGDNQHDSTLPEGQGTADREPAGPGAPAAKRRPSRALIAWLAVVLVLVLIGFVLAGVLLLGIGPSLFSRRCVVDAPQGGQCA